MDSMKLRGQFRLEVWRQGKIVESEVLNNLITYEGFDHLLDSTFDAATQVANWYIGFIDNSGFSAVAIGDTHDSHAGWTETTPYSDATRVEWGPDAAVNGVITNSTSADFTINATAAINGIFISNISTKGSTASGVLFNAASLAAVKNVVSGDTVKVTYQLTAS